MNNEDNSLSLSLSRQFWLSIVQRVLWHRGQLAKGYLETRKLTAPSGHNETLQQIHMTVADQWC